MPGLLSAVDDVFASCLALLDEFDANSWRKQFHSDLSPAGWHIGHMAFIESYWLREQVLGDNSNTEYAKQLYLPWLSEKASRGQRLPDKHVHIAECMDAHRQNLELYQTLVETGCEHELLQDNYLAWFLLQHHAQHRETLHYIMQQRQLQRSQHFAVTQVLQPSAACRPKLQLDTATVRLGHEAGPVPYDNELPAHSVHIARCHVAAEPVSNSEYLGFMEDNGYRTRECWSAAGWAWQQQSRHDAPEHWRRDDSGNWYGITPFGPAQLEATRPVTGISYHEADAFARWAGARLPHETEWEAAARLRPETFQWGGAWEWCANPFYPYEGFTAFPYDGYSLHWFDGEHHTLRGASPWTSDWVRRPSFRNFYTRDKRHIFAGLRLAGNS